MEVIDSETVPAETPTKAGVEGTTVQWLIDGSLAPNFAMRRFVIDRDGRIPLHEHPYEHEIYILHGRGIAVTPDGETTLNANDVIYVPPDEPHGWKNAGTGPLILLCFIPLDGHIRR